MSRQAIEAHMQALGRWCENALHCAARADIAGDLQTAATFYEIAQLHSAAAFEWAALHGGAL